MKSHNNFKLSFSERSLDLVIGFKFEFDVIWGSLASLGAQLFKNWSFLVWFDLRSFVSMGTHLI